MTRPPVLRAYLGDDEIHVDLFAGGGGASLGAARATGRSPDIAINHSPAAIAMHLANHPTTTHYIENVYKVNPRKVTKGRRVALLWLSPDCTHHSKARGGPPREQKIRGLAWSAMPWVKHARPRVIVLENVEEWVDWGPLHRQHAPGCRQVPLYDENGDRVRTTDGKPAFTCSVKKCRFGRPIVARKGETFRAWCRKLEKKGYAIEHKLLRACDYGAPTTRRRLFLVARCDGQPIRWPAPTHGPSKGRQLEIGGVQPYRTAAEIIDWSIPCPSIFDRDRPLADKTMARIARGIRRYVLESARPFVIPVNHGGVGRTDHRVHDIDAPMPTVTGGQRGGHALVTPYLMPNNTNNVPKGADEPVPTITTGNRNFLVTPIVVKAKTHGGGGNDARAADEPLRTITASPRGEFAVAVPYLVHRSNGERKGQEPRIYDAHRPLGTIVAQGQKHALCTAFLARHYSERATGGWNGGSDASSPIGTITAKDHHSVVAAHLTKLYGTSTGSDATDPVPTVTGTGQHIGAVAAHLVRYNGDRPGAERVADVESPLGTQDTSNRYALVAAFLARYNRTGENRSVRDPVGCVDTRDRYALVTVSIDGEEYAIVDIGMRMLTPRELFCAQGFPEDYVIDPVGPDGKKLTKTAQIRACGNSVPPQLATAIVAAQFGEHGS
jgi:DNA (cytosine-5)-methyltransferase 1